MRKSIDWKFLERYLRGEVSALHDPRAARLDYKTLIALFNLIPFPAVLAVLAEQSPDTAKALMQFLIAGRIALPLFPTIGAVVFPYVVYEGLEGPGRRYTGNLPKPTDTIRVPVVGDLPRQHVIIGIAFLWLMQTMHGIYSQLESKNGFARFLDGFYSNPVAVAFLQPIFLALVGAIASGMIAVGKTWYNKTSQWNVDQFALGYAGRPRSFVVDVDDEHTSFLSGSNNSHAACSIKSNGNGMFDQKRDTAINVQQNGLDAVIPR